jgi:pentatricopeptide repeat protein
VQCGEIKRAQSLFESATKKTLSMHGAMMKGKCSSNDWEMFDSFILLPGYMKNEMFDQAIDLFKQMKQHDAVILILLFNVCARVKTESALNLVKQVASSIPKSFYSNPRLLPSLIDALMKCGDVRQARSLFDRSTRKILPLYGTVIKG